MLFSGRHLYYVDQSYQLAVQYNPATGAVLGFGCASARSTPFPFASAGTLAGAGLCAFDVRGVANLGGTKPVLWTVEALGVAIVCEGADLPNTLPERNSEEGTSLSIWSCKCSIVLIQVYTSTRKG